MSQMASQQKIVQDFLIAVGLIFHAVGLCIAYVIASLVLYLSVVPIMFSKITLKKFRRLFKNEVNLKICPKITSFNFSLMNDT